MSNLGFNNKLKELRKEKNISQEQLAKELNISRQAISKWESGKAYPDIDNLILLRKIFGVSLDELIMEEEEKVEENNSKQELIESSEKGIFEDIDSEAEEFSVNLILGGFIIGIGIGLVAENFMWGTAGAFIGIGIGYLLESVKK
ncbi:helix-turn-helix domain-containing protein [Clostridium perfringens]|uniref:helix-turn-helix transcriptional regulator n=2 Tax=Clostridium perfringens TaxID=1502 RepID=UPI001FA8224D|nr:helix-turn-helix transcriptional regulator [Clostridium perfringens]MCX0362457.1 helix-turn-helix domain-containing protein [Clostridium perfringens]MCX0392706.1 helix-turn-helix domain-containing protein [Clostridium perfringens]MDK0693191.1 helix-turn-helix transcriptional regulator [Clostridium perfringens]MDK0709637.1 helix-turn-helix transcriptional regulator [Clostridium perfringens]MDK0712676.1 helix-turn-helix transcriptional regulator [Clostridium perfringens]